MGSKTTAAEVLVPDKKSPMYDRGTMKVVVLACIIIILSIVMTSSISYLITQEAVVDKLKSRDMRYIIDSMAAKIDGRIERAKEVSVILATDPAVIQWVASGETDERLGEYAKGKITGIARDYDYSNTFIVSNITKHYWAEDSRLISIMSESNPEHNWFFSALHSGKTVDLNIDSNTARGDTFVFINALMKDQGTPVAIVGVGLTLKEIAKEFKSYKFGEQSNLWLVDGQGKIHLSEKIEEIGMYLNDFVAPDIASQIIEGNISSNQPQAIEYTNQNGEIMDLVYRVTKSTDWKLVFQIPRRESISILSTIKVNAGIGSFISLVLIIFIFYYISHRIANPFKRAILLSKEMEKQVSERTQELSEKNQKIMDSIDYAQRIQESILPPSDELINMFREYFIIWEPRDRVGGDFYWARKIDKNKSLIAVADCTGHGVPGAFMTMAVNSILSHIVDEICDNPAVIIQELNKRVKETLHRNQSSSMADDGLDIGICYVEDKKRLVFAGAKIALDVKRADQVYHIKGNKKSIGYRRSSNDLEFVNNEWKIEDGDIFYLMSDGYVDQNGGQRDYALGHKRVNQLISAQGEKNLAQQQQAFEDLLNQYMGDEPQRDDITVVGFTF
ncbi:MAG: protein serine/threonine phosphatase [Firmicutes bacterium]|nr:protein serine/threonine phosphatase [Bacillota bacterium]